MEACAAYTVAMLGASVAQDTYLGIYHHQKNIFVRHQVYLQLGTAQPLLKKVLPCGEKARS